MSAGLTLIGVCTDGMLDRPVSSGGNGGGRSDLMAGSSSGVSDDDLALLQSSAAKTALIDISQTIGAARGGVSSLRFSDNTLKACGWIQSFQVKTSLTDIDWARERRSLSDIVTGRRKDGWSSQGITVDDMSKVIGGLRKGGWPFQEHVTCGVSTEVNADSWAPRGGVSSGTFEFEAGRAR